MADTTEQGRARIQEYIIREDDLVKELLAGGCSPSLARDLARRLKKPAKCSNKEPWRESVSCIHRLIESIWTRLERLEHPQDCDRAYPDTNHTEPMPNADDPRIHELFDRIHRLENPLKLPEDRVNLISTPGVIGWHVTLNGEKKRHFMPEDRAIAIGYAEGICEGLREAQQ